MVSPPLPITLRAVTLLQQLADDVSLACIGYYCHHSPSTVLSLARTSMQLSAAAAAAAARCMLTSCSSHTSSFAALYSAMPKLLHSASSVCSRPQHLPAEITPCRTWGPQPCSPVHTWSLQAAMNTTADPKQQHTASGCSTPVPLSLLHSRQYQTSCAQLVAPQHASSNTDQEQQQQQEQAPAQAASTQDQPSVLPLSQDVVYQGPLSQTHKLLKRISIANTAIALAAAPAIVMYADVSYVSRLGLAASLVAFGILTTGALHWVTHPYVHELRYTAATQSIEAKTTSLFGRPKLHHFKLSDVQPLPWNRPVATFMAKGNYFYIDVYSFPDEELLKRLTPPEDSVPAGYKDDKDDD